MKLKSSATLFALLGTDDSVFQRILYKYFEGKADERTIELAGH